MRGSRLIAIVFGLVVVIGMLIARVYDPYPVRALRDFTFDEIQRFSPRPYEDFPVRIVDIDEASLAKLGQWPWPRDRIAEIVSRLTELGAAAIVFDVIFVEPDRMSPRQIIRNKRLVAALGDENARAIAENLPDNDTVFAEAIATAPVVLGFSILKFGIDNSNREGEYEPKSGFAFTGTDPMSAAPKMATVTHNISPLHDAAAGLGSISLNPDDVIDVVRKIPLVWSDGGQFWPSLVVEALRVAQGASTIVVRGAGDVSGVIDGLQVGAFAIPTATNGEFWIWYGHDRSERFLSAAKVLSEGDETLRPLVEGNIVLVGASASGLLDIRATALGENVAGVSIHAQVLEQIISGTFIQRTDWVEGLELLGFALTGTMLVISGVFSGPILSFVLGAVIAGLVVLITWVAFNQYGLLVDPSFGLVGGLGVYFALTSFRFLVSDREKRRIRRAFAQYVAPSVLEEIESDPEKLRLGGEIREVTVMFSDVRNFTPLSERLEPVELVALLNRLLGALSEHVITESGTIDKYIGDSLMAFWNAPTDIVDHEIHACHAALLMRQSLAELNAAGAFDAAATSIDGKATSDAPVPDTPAPDTPNVAIAIGICTGEACVGNMGSEQRFDYSVIGDTVNVAARVENACRHVAYDIMIAQPTADKVPEFALLNAGSIALKGKSDRLGLQIIVGDEEMRQSPAFQDLAECHTRFLATMKDTGRLDRDGLAACIELATKISGDLVTFYQRVPGRLEDFVGAIAPATETASQDNALDGEAISMLAERT